jgi:hypothetical protein
MWDIRVKRTKAPNLIRLYIVGALLLVLSSALLSPRAAQGEEQGGSGVDAALTGGVRLVDIEGETYGFKAVPVLGVSLFPRFELTTPLYLSIEISLSYTFKSDYSGFYYYDSFGSIGILPEIGFLFPGRGVDWALFMGGGVFYSFSEYDTGIHPAVSARAGIEFEKGFVRGIFLSYSHYFVEGFQTHESFKLFFTTRLFNTSYKGRD